MSKRKRISESRCKVGGYLFIAHNCPLEELDCQIRVLLDVVQVVINVDTITVDNHDVEVAVDSVFRPVLPVHILRKVWVAECKLCGPIPVYRECFFRVHNRILQLLKGERSFKYTEK